MNVIDAVEKVMIKFLIYNFIYNNKIIIFIIINVK